MCVQINTNNLLVYNIVTQQPYKYYICIYNLYLYIFIIFIYNYVLPAALFNQREGHYTVLWEENPQV